MKYSMLIEAKTKTTLSSQEMQKKPSTDPTLAIHQRTDNQNIQGT
jgi:hypothetical protein